MPSKLSDEMLALRLRDLRKRPLGSLGIISTKINRNSSGYLTVTVYCRLCRAFRAVLVDNIEKGNTTTCLCQRALKFDDAGRRLSERYHAIVQRCSNPLNDNWNNYGGRGIRNKFDSAEQFVAYCQSELPHPTYKGLDIGRKENDGHYEPGNLRLETRGQNARNKRSNHWIIYKGMRIVIHDLRDHLVRDYPGFDMQSNWVERLINKGFHWKEIVNEEVRLKKLKSLT